MIIAIAAKENTLESPVHPNESEAPYLVIANTQTGELHAVDNREQASLPEEGMTRTLRLLCDHQVERFYTGQLALNDREMLARNGIVIVLRTDETTVEAVLSDLIREGIVPGRPVTTDRPTCPTFASPPEGYLRMAVPADAERALDSHRSEHFGHCNGWVLIDLFQGGVKDVFHLPNPDHESGNCLAAVDLLAANAVQALIVDGIGGNPYRGFQQKGIAVYRGSGKTVGESVSMFADGKLSLLGEDALCGHHH